MSLRDIYERYHDQVQFLSIYIREGGILGTMMKMGVPNAATDIDDPKTYEERQGVARQCAETLQYSIRTYVDEMDDAVSKAYAAKPTRLYLVGLDGRVVYAGGPGPYGFSPAVLKKAIEEYFGSAEFNSTLEFTTGDRT